MRDFRVFAMQIADDCKGFAREAAKAGHTEAAGIAFVLADRAEELAAEYIPGRSDIGEAKHVAHAALKPRKRGETIPAPSMLSPRGEALRDERARSGEVPKKRGRKSKAEKAAMAAEAAARTAPLPGVDVEVTEEEESGGANGLAPVPEWGTTTAHAGPA